MDLGSFFPDKSSIYYYSVIGICIVIALYLNDAFENVNISLPNIFSTQNTLNQQNQFKTYGYDDLNGPAIWENMFPEAGCSLQSPIHLRTSNSTRMSIDSVANLCFSKEYDKTPLEMLLYNTGHCVVLYTSYCGKRPTITGGPLEDDTYEFLNIRFRWGQTDVEGSEHMVDGRRYAMEMQLAFVKSGSIYNDVLEVARNHGLVMLSYFFMPTCVENPYLEPIVTAMRCLKYPSSCIQLNAYPIALLAPQFTRNFFYYTGSLTFPPCTEGVRWIIQSEPLTITEKQIKKFRKILGCNLAPLVANCRPVQMLNERDVMYYF